MSNVIPFDYQGVPVQFNLDGWESALAKASAAGKKKVIYCIKFSHGMMKVGRTSNMRTRLKAISAHGINNALVSDIFIEPVIGNLAYAEACALKRFSAIATQIGPEIFSLLDDEKIADVLKCSALEAASIDEKKKTEPVDFDDVARSSGMYEAFIHIAIDRAESMGLTDRARELKQIVAETPKGQLGEVVRLMTLSLGGGK